MKYWGLVFVAMGLLQGFITYRNKNKVSIYIRYREIEVIEAEGYFKLQMKYGLVGSPPFFLICAIPSFTETHLQKMD